MVYEMFNNKNIEIIYNNFNKLLTNKTKRYKISKIIENCINIRLNKNVNYDFFGLSYSKNNYADFWYDIYYNKEKKEINIFNTHREVFVKKEGLGKIMLGTTEEIFKRFAKENRLAMNIIFIDCNGQNDTIKFLEKNNYYKAFLDENISTGRGLFENLVLKKSLNY